MSDESATLRSISKLSYGSAFSRTFAKIFPCKEHNFNKYDNRTITDYGIGYDYKSVMHYSSHAFSKNGEPTITPKKEKVQLGQRNGLSKKDVAKIQAMYKEQCGDHKPEGNNDNSSDSFEEISLGWIFN